MFGYGLDLGREDFRFNIAGFAPVDTAEPATSAAIKSVAGYVKTPPPAALPTIITQEAQESYAVDESSNVSFLPVGVTTTNQTPNTQNGAVSSGFAQTGLTTAIDPALLLMGAVIIGVAIVIRKAT